MKDTPKEKQIVVSASATRSSGTLTIYKQFVEHLPRHTEGMHFTIFVHPSMPQPEIAHVDYIPIHTENQLQRIKFDWYGSCKELKKRGIKPDAIVSLQNTGLRCLKEIPHLIYYHLPFPFFEYKYNLLERNELILKLYKELYPFFVKKAITPSTHMVAQIPFIAEGLEKRFCLPQAQVHTLFPDLEYGNIDKVDKYADWNDGKSHFVFPATAFRYKGHNTIAEALRIVKARGVKDVVFHFTITRDALPKLCRAVRQLGVEDMIDFMGTVSHERLLQMYKSSVGLIFPSVIETLGLPLIEASAFGLPVVASDVRFAHEVIGSYEGASFIPPYDFKMWADTICRIVNDKPHYKPYVKGGESSWKKFFEIINELAQK